MKILQTSEWVGRSYFISAKKRRTGFAIQGKASMLSFFKRTSEYITVRFLHCIRFVSKYCGLRDISI